MSGEWIILSQSHLWVPPSLSRQSLVRVVNYTLLLIPVVPRLSTNVKSVKPWLTQCWEPPKTLKSRAHSSKEHTTLNAGCVKILYRREIQWHKPSKTYFCHFYHYRVFLGSDSCGNKSHTTPDTGVTKFSTNERSVYLNTHFLSITESFSAVTRARSESITRLLLLWSVAQFSTNMRFGELNLHRRAFEYHRVPLGSDSSA